MGVARLARVTGDWPGYERARDNAVRLVLTHRIEDEVSRFRQVMIACTGLQNWGEDARELILKRLSDAFLEGTARGQSAHDVIVQMQRRPGSDRREVDGPRLGQLRDAVADVVTWRAARRGTGRSS